MWRKIAPALSPQSPGQARGGRGGSRRPTSPASLRNFPVSLSSSFKSSEGLAPFVALDVSVLRAHFNRRHSAAGFETGGSERASSLPGA